MPEVTVTQAIHASGIVRTRRVYPIYWCPIPPLTSFAIPNLEVKAMSLETDNIPFERAGWYEVAGYLISNTQPLTSNLNMSSVASLVDDYIHKISQPDFDVSSAGIDGGERFQSVKETTGPDSETNVPGQTMEQDPAEEGDPTGGQYGKGVILSHPGVLDQAQELGLGASKVYYYSSTLGFPYGKSVPVDEKRVHYVDDFNVSLNGMYSANRYNVFILVVSIPELGATESVEGMFHEQMAPWDTWEDMIQTFQEVPFFWSDAMDTEDEMQTLSGNRQVRTGRQNFANTPIFNNDPSIYRELIEWKRFYKVGDDSWKNSDMRFWMRGSAVLSAPFTLYRSHI